MGRARCTGVVALALASATGAGCGSRGSRGAGEEIGSVSAPLRARIVRVDESETRVVGLEKGVPTAKTREASACYLELEQPAARVRLRRACAGRADMKAEADRIAFRCDGDEKPRWRFVLLGGDGRVFQHPRALDALDWAAAPTLARSFPELFATDAEGGATVVTEVRARGGDDAVAALLVEAAPALVGDAVAGTTADAGWRRVFDALPEAQRAKVRAGLRKLLEAPLAPARLRDADLALYWPAQLLDLRDPTLAPVLTARLREFASVEHEPRRHERAGQLVVSFLRALLAGAPAAHGELGCALLTRGWARDTSARAVASARAPCPAIWPALGTWAHAANWGDPPENVRVERESYGPLYEAALAQPGGAAELALRRARLAYRIEAPEAPACALQPAAPPGAPCKCSEPDAMLRREAAATPVGVREASLAGCRVTVDDAKKTLRIAQAPPHSEVP